jgi:hypothetical protein
VPGDGRVHSHLQPARASLESKTVLFLIDYDRHRAEIVELREFDDTERLRAQYQQLQIERNLTRRGLLLREVVLIEASDLFSLQRAHRRYFQTATERWDDMCRKLPDPQFH